MRRLAATIILLTSLFTVCLAQRPGPRKSGALTQYAYVWQRRWSKPLKETLKTLPSDIQGLNILAGELTWTRKGDKARLVHVPWQKNWLPSKGPIVLSLRIAEYSGSFDSDSKATQTVIHSVRAILRKAKQSEAKIDGLQLDFDCPSSKLEGYRRWTKLIQSTFPSVKLSITTLPTWLGERAFARLVQSLDHFVLQVHSFQRPKRSRETLTTCSSRSALRWVEEAAALETPFFVALPTYSYRVHFDSRGQFFSISADAGPKQRPVHGTTRIVRSSAEEMAALVRVWQRSRPASMLGVIWYRLPLPQDQLNWPMETLRSVMKGRRPSRQFELTIESKRPGLWELYLVNSGDRELMRGPEIRVSWSEGDLVAFDCFGSYSWIREDRNHSQLKFGGGQRQSFVLKPGERYLVAWLRMAGGNYVEATIPAGS